MMMNESTRLLAAEEDRDGWSGKPCPAGAEGHGGSSCCRVKSARALVSTLLLFQHSTQALYTPALPTSVLDVLHLLRSPMDGRGFRSSSCFVTFSSMAHGYCVIHTEHHGQQAQAVKDCHVEALFGIQSPSGHVPMLEALVFGANWANIDPKEWKPGTTLSNMLQVASMTG